MHYVRQTVLLDKGPSRLPNDWWSIGWQILRHAKIDHSGVRIGNWKHFQKEEDIKKIQVERFYFSQVHFVLCICRLYRQKSEIWKDEHGYS